jgi:hypothetical protein
MFLSALDGQNDSVQDDRWVMVQMEQSITGMKLTEATGCRDPMATTDNRIERLLIVVFCVECVAELEIMNAEFQLNRIVSNEPSTRDDAFQPLQTLYWCVFWNNETSTCLVTYWLSHFKSTQMNLACASCFTHNNSRHVNTPRTPTLFGHWHFIILRMA